MFDSVVDRLGEFKSPELLKIQNCTNRSICTFDGMIERCQSIKSLHFTTQTRSLAELLIYEMDNDADDYDASMDLSLIYPRHGIHHFQGNFVFFSSNSVDYFIHKFPNLHKLELNTYHDEVSPNITGIDLPSPVMNRFFNWALGIPMVDIDHIYMNTPNTLLKSALEFTRFSGTLTIKYESFEKHNIHEMWRGKGPRIQIKKSNSETPMITLAYPMVSEAESDSDDEGEQDDFTIFHKAVKRGILPQKKIIETSATLIRYLYLFNFDTLGPYQYVKAYNCCSNKILLKQDYLGFILRLCTSLKALTLENTNIGISDSNRESTINTSLDALMIVSTLEPPSIQFLKNLSYLLPNLQHLHVKCGEMATAISDKGQSMLIFNMPYTSFKTLRYTGTGLEVYSKFMLKVVSKTWNGTQYYRCDDLCHIKKCSLNDFVCSIRDPDFFSIYIDCINIKKFAFDVNGKKGAIRFNEKKRCFPILFK